MSHFEQCEYKNTDSEMRYVQYRSTLERSQPIVVVFLDLHFVPVIMRIINVILIIRLINNNYYN